MKTGYARESTRDQNPDLQPDELKSYGCETVYKEKVSGKNKSQPEAEKLIDQLRSGDVIVVRKPDRPGRSPQGSDIILPGKGG